MNEKKPSIAIILPAYNEELTVAETIRMFHAVAEDAFFCVVNNNSSDNTVAEAQKAFTELGVRGVILHEYRQGKANAVRRAFLEVDADIYVMADADCTYPADQLPELLQPILEGRADMVCGDRLSGGHYARENTRSMHEFGNNLVRNLINFLFRARYTDIMTGYRAMTKAVVKCYPILVEGFQIETDISIFAAMARLRVVEVQVRYSDRPAGSVSKLSTLKDGFLVLSTIFNIFRYYNPILFFSIISGLLLFLSTVFGSVVIAEYVQTQYITHVPLAILASSLGVLAVVFFSIGLVLDALRYQQKTTLEARIQDHSPPTHRA